MLVQKSLFMVIIYYLLEGFGFLYLVSIRAVETGSVWTVKKPKTGRLFSNPGCVPSKSNHSFPYNVTYMPMLANLNQNDLSA